MWNPNAAVKRRYQEDLEDLFSVLECGPSDDRVIDLVENLAKQNPDVANQCAVARSLCRSVLPANDSPVKRIASYYPTIKGGGIETAMLALTRDLGESCEACIIVENIDNEQAETLGIDVHLLKAEGGLSRQRALAALVKDKRIDTVVYHAWFGPHLLWDVLLLRCLGVRVVLNTHGVFSHFLDVTNGSFAPWNDGRLFVLVSETSRLCNAVVSATKANKHFFGYFNDCSYCISNVLEDRFWRDASPVRNNRIKTILWVGRFDIYKHPEDAVRIFQKIKTVVPDSKLVLVGESGYETYEQELKDLAVALGVEDDVEFAGFADPLSYYDQADVLISTTEIEGFCMVLLEACARGLPIVAYDLPYLPFAQCDGIQWVDQGDVDGAACLAASTLADDSLRASKAQAVLEFAHEKHYASDDDSWGRVISDLPSSLGKTRISNSDDMDQIMWATLFDHYMVGQKRTRSFIEKEFQRVSSEKDAETRQIVADVSRVITDEYENSISYRLGKALLAPLRGLRRLFRF